MKTVTYDEYVKNLKKNGIKIEKVAFCESSLYAKTEFKEREEEYIKDFMDLSERRAESTRREDVASKLIEEHKSGNITPSHYLFTWDKDKGWRKNLLHEISILKSSIIIVPAEIENEVIHKSAYEIPIYYNNCDYEKSSLRRCFKGGETEIRLDHLLEDTDAQKRLYVQVAKKLMSLCDKYAQFKKINYELNQVKIITQSIINKYQRRRDEDEN